MPSNFHSKFVFLPLFIAISLFLNGCSDSNAKSSAGSGVKEITITNVSYDPTRELYKEFNDAFAEHWEKQTGEKVTIDQSHGGSGSQSRKVIEGLGTDVVTLALAYDIDAIANKGFINTEWQKRLPHNSAPYTSTIVFLVRKGNPKQIKDWADLGKGDVQVITPNPKTGGGARWNYLAAWGAVLKQELGDLKKLHDPSAKEAVAKAHEKARDFVTELFKRVKVMDASARASTTTFIERTTGDVLISWENEALFVSNSAKYNDQFDIVVPSISILAEPPVAVVDRNVDKSGSRKVAEAYLQYLYTSVGQQIIAKNHYRPVQPDQVAEELRKQFLQVELFSIDDVFGGWNKAQAEHFNDGGVFDQVLKAAHQ